MLSRALVDINKRAALMVSGMIALIAVCLIFAFRSSAGDMTSNAEERGLFADVKRVVSGHKIKLDVDKAEDEYLVYAGIRSPYPGEAGYDEARQRNALLVEGQRVRLRFDVEERDEEGRRVAYVFTTESLVNELLVKEGLAFVRLTPNTMRYADRLLKAQSEARKKSRGVWKHRVESNESAYRADPKYGAFHRPSCEIVTKMPTDRGESFPTRDKALDNGYAPCSKCNP